jgi:hypothetical protein
LMVSVPVRFFNAGLGCSAARRSVDPRVAVVPGGSGKQLAVRVVLGEGATADRARETSRRARAWVIEDLGCSSSSRPRLGPAGHPHTLVRSGPYRDRRAGPARRHFEGPRHDRGPPPGLVACGDGGVLEQRPHQWQTRTADLDLLDSTIDETHMSMRSGFEGPVEFLIDRADVHARFEQDRDSQLRLHHAMQSDLSSPWRPSSRADSPQ